MEERLIDTVLGLDPLSNLPRTGWLLRGVVPCESIAEHSFGVALVSLLLVDALRAEGHVVDGERVARMALVHDAPEAKTGDVPMPSKTREAAEALAELEERVAREVLPPALFEAFVEYERTDCLEARIVRAADKIQMMIKVLAYERAGRGHLQEFWDNPKNFRDAGLPIAVRVYEAIRRRRTG